MKKYRRPCDEEILAAMNRIERDMIIRGDPVPEYHFLKEIALGHLKARMNFERMQLEWQKAVIATQKEVK